MGQIKEMRTAVQSQVLEGRYHLGDPAINQMIILKWSI
jgi:hypothetical protein